MKLANWNVGKPVSQARRDAMLKHLGQVTADLLVLTETHDGFKPGYKNVCSSASGRDGKDLEQHRWASIWSNDELELLETNDKERTVAARVIPNKSEPFIVFATVLPWLGSTWHDHPSPGGVAFYESLKVQKADWQLLRDKYPTEEFFVIGDFNQALVDSRYYGSKKNRRELESALQDTGLIALTAGKNDPIARDSSPCACIDHICILGESKWELSKTERWPNIEKPMKSLSDHFGVAVTLELRSRR